MTPTEPLQHRFRTAEGAALLPAPTDPQELVSWIKLQLDVRKLSLAKISLAAGFQRNAAVRALRGQWPEVEAIVARALGVHPRDLWPNRYHEDGCPNVSHATHYVRHTYPHWRQHTTPQQGPKGAA